MRNSKSPGPVGSRRSRRRSAPYWTKRGDANSATRRAVHDHIESPAAVSRYRDVNLRALGAARQLWRLHRKISNCSAVDPRRESLCARCASDYRLWLAPELMTLARLGPPAFVAAILLQSGPGPRRSRLGRCRPFSNLEVTMGATTPTAGERDTYLLYNTPTSSDSEPWSRKAATSTVSAG
jgi:hypothetical protein